MKKNKLSHLNESFESVVENKCNKAIAIFPNHMYNESGRRPASVSSLNVCLFVKPTEESLDRPPHRGYGRREQVIGSLVPLLFLLDSTLYGLDWR